MHKGFSFSRYISMIQDTPDKYKDLGENVITS